MNAPQNLVRLAISLPSTISKVTSGFSGRRELQGKAQAVMVTALDDNVAAVIIAEEEVAAQLVSQRFRIHLKTGGYALQKPVAKLHRMAIGLRNMFIGYARVSTTAQDNTAQIDALKAARCELIFEEKVSGRQWERPELHRLIGQLRRGDTVVVWKLDRLSCSLRDLAGGAPNSTPISSRRSGIS